MNTETNEFLDSRRSGSGLVLKSTLALVVCIAPHQVASAASSSASVAIRYPDKHAGDAVVSGSNANATSSGWTQLLEELDARCATAGGSTDADGEFLSDRALATLRRVYLRAAAKMPRPDVWGPDGDGGFFAEQHGTRTVLLRINSQGRARLSVFRGIDRDGVAEIL
jgi:hypothetical protein